MSYSKVPVGIGLLWVVAVFGFRAWRSRIHSATYRLTTKESQLVFESHLGRFVFDRNKETFSAVYLTSKKVAVPFADIRNIEVITEDTDAMLEEFVLEGGSVLIDTNEKYRDFIKKSMIAVVTQSFQRYPLIRMSQYTVRDLPNWGNDVMLDLLSMMRLYTPIEFYTDGIYARIKEFLGKRFRFDRE